MANAQGTILRVDDWVLRCKFNSGDYDRQLQAGALIEKKKRVGTPDSSVGLPYGSVSEEVMYLDAETNKEVVKFHQYRLPDGSIGASGRRDPKRIKDGDIWYRRMQGSDESKRDPCLLFPKRGRWRLWYADFRRWCCHKYGPNRDRLLALVVTPVLRLVFFFTKTTCP